MPSTQTARQKKSFLEKNPIEQLGSTFTKQVNTDSKAMMQEFWRQILGVKESDNPMVNQGEMQNGEAVFLSKIKQHEQLQQEAKPAIRAAYDYTEEIRNIGKSNKKESQELQYKLEEIIGELQRLATASVVLEKEVIEATGQTIVNPGKYHLNFFEWLLIEIRQARIQVEDASGWLATVSSKNGKKKNYWTMYKSHGTKFGLSGERSVSTQTA